MELVRGASVLHRQLAKLLFLSEHLLAAIMTHLRSCALPGGTAGGGAQERLAPIEALGSERVSAAPALCVVRCGAGGRRVLRDAATTPMGPILCRCPHPHVASGPGPAAAAA